MRVVRRDSECELIAGPLPHARVRGHNHLEEAQVVSLWECHVGDCAAVQLCDIFLRTAHRCGSCITTAADKAQDGISTIDNGA